MKRKPEGNTVTIGDEEIIERFGADVLPALDADPHTKTYQPFYNGRHNRTEVEKAMAARRSVDSQSWSRP